jgi:hypothetical protein
MRPPVGAPVASSRCRETSPVPGRFQAGFDHATDGVSPALRCRAADGDEEKGGVR